jgi:hypothetical protein
LLFYPIKHEPRFRQAIKWVHPLICVYFYFSFAWRLSDS